MVVSTGIDLPRKDRAARRLCVCIGQQQSSMFGLQGGFGSSSLKECIELLNAAVESAPAPLDSGVGQKSTDPPRGYDLLL